MKDPPRLSAPLRSAPGIFLRGVAKPGGFTLLELVFYAATSGLVLTAATIAILVSMRSNALFELHQREEARLSRISSLIQSETTEAKTVELNSPSPAPAQCEDLNGSSSRFTLQIPNPNSAPSAGPVSVHYYQRGSGVSAELLRCGPPYKDDGSLDFDALSSTAIVALSTELAVNAANSGPQQIRYTLTFWRPSSLVDSGNTSQESKTSPVITASVGVK